MRNRIYNWRINGNFIRINRVMIRLEKTHPGYANYGL